MNHLRPLRTWIITPVVTTASLVSLAGCGIFQDRQDRLASTHLAVLSVESFESARQNLSPNFKLSGDDAVKLVNPTIGVSTRSTLDALRASGELSLDITPDALGVGEDAAPALPGSAPRAPTFTPPQSFKDALDQSSSLRTSRILEYQLAQSLFEQVAMLNATVASAAVPAGYEGHIVQLQLGVMPRMEKLERDVYADIAFFAVSKNLPAQTSTDSRLVQQASLLGPNAANADGISRRIRVVPLLSTDSLESVVNSASLDKLRALSGGLRLAADRVSAGGSVERVLEQIEASLGKQLFSSYSVARLSENTLRARFGAVPTGLGSSSVVPRTHKVSVLVLIPNDLAQQLRGSGTDIELLASAKTTLINPKDGEESEPLDFPRLVQEGMAQIAPYFALPGQSTLLTSSDIASVVKLAVVAQENDYQGFLDRSNLLIAELKRRASVPACSQLVAEVTPESLWIEVIGLVTKTQYSGARFTIAKPPLPQMTPPTHVFALDDGKSWTITLSGILASRIRAEQCAMTVPDLANGTFFPEQVLEGKGGEAKLVFPPLKGIVTAPSLTVTLNTAESAFITGRHTTTMPVQRVSIKAPSPDPVPLLTTSTKFINKANGTAVAVIAVNFASFGDRRLPTFTLKGANAAITGVTASPADGAILKNGTALVSKDCVITLTMTGLSDDQDVTLQAQDADNRPLAVDGKEVAFRVR